MAFTGPQTMLNLPCSMSCNRSPLLRLFFGLVILSAFLQQAVGAKLYWTNSDSSKIQRANLDGTQVEDLVVTPPLKMTTILISVCFLIAISVGCQEAPLNDLKGDAQEAIGDARTKARALRELSAEELQEIWAIEYKTIEVTHSDLAALDEQLNELGQERWDCYHVSEDGEGKVFYFKRGKSNAISYLTNLLRLGSIAF